MADEVTTAVVKTKDQLLAELQTAMDAGEWKSISSISSQISKLVKTEESAERDAKLVALKDITIKVMKAIEKAIKPFVDAGDLDIADGVWFSNDFGEKLTDCRLVKSQAKARTGGGGGGKKFDIKTSELLERFGSERIVKDGVETMTFNDSYAANTDGNHRYGLRQKMLKLANMS